MHRTLAPETSFPLRAAALGAAALLLGSLADGVQAQTLTPQPFVDACRTNAANTVLLTQQTQFQTNASTTTFRTPTGCTVVLGTGASLELDTVTLAFGGPFTVQGGTNTKVVLDKATLTAPSVALNLTGFEGQFQMDEAQLAATSGDLSIAFGEKGKMEIKNSGRWYQPRLSARGVLRLNTGPAFTGVVVSSGLQGARGISFAFDGFDTAMKIEGSDLLLSSGASGPGPYTAGNFQVSGSAAKVGFELIQVNLMEASQSVNVALSGAESKLGFLNVRSQTGSGRIALAASGEKGEVKVENVLLQGNPEVVVESGSFGSTRVTNSPGTISATQAIRIRTGLNGACSASTQGLSAPVLQVCR